MTSPLQCPALGAAPWLMMGAFDEPIANTTISA
jgi:hypothetical protein